MSRMSLTKVQFLVLACLMRQPMHLYAIRQQIIDLTDHTYYPRGSTVKQATEALLNKGLIKECDSDPHHWLKARRGAPYELTEDGQGTLRRETGVYFGLCQMVRLWESGKPRPLY